MTPSILNVNNIDATMTSLDLVERINSARRIEANESAPDGQCINPVALRHDHFMVKLEKHPGIDSPKFLGQYKDSTGRTLKCYFLPRRECELMIMSESLLVQTRVYDQLAAMSAVPAIPQSLSAALRLAADQAEQIERQQAQLAIAAPKADALDRIAGAEGSMCITDAAKAIKLQPKRLFAWMHANDWIYKRAGSKKWVACQSRLKSAHLDCEYITVLRADGTEKNIANVLVTAKGLAKLAEVAA